MGQLLCSSVKARQTSRPLRVHPTRRVTIASAVPVLGHNSTNTTDEESVSANARSSGTVSPSDQQPGHHKAADNTDVSYPVFHQSYTHTDTVSELETEPEVQAVPTPPAVPSSPIFMPRAPPVQTLGSYSHPSLNPVATPSPTDFDQEQRVYLCGSVSVRDTNTETMLWERSRSLYRHTADQRLDSPNTVLQFIIQLNKSAPARFPSCPLPRAACYFSGIHMLASRPS